MAGNAPTARFAAGDRVGDYQIDHEVVEHAAGIVYLATHVMLPRQAHVKVTRDCSRSAALQVLREACILEAIAHPGHPGHPGIPRVYECGVLADRRPWSALERMAGIPFDQLVGEGALPAAEIAIAVRETADMLRHAHERGVVHGALTASAIIRTLHRRSAYAIGDWSHARTLDADAAAAVDPRDDVHALGAIAFRALTGASAELGGSAAALCPAAPAELSELITQMLAEPVVRPTAREVFDRAAWLCDALQIAPSLERLRSKSPQGFVREDAAHTSSDDDHRGFAVRISRTRTH
jgi:serine/threonine protein kinase